MVIVFSKAKISLETALLFRNVALSVRMMMLPLLKKKILTGEKGVYEEVESLQAVTRAQAQLLEVFRTTVIEQSDKLDQTLAELQTTNADLRTYSRRAEGCPVATRQFRGKNSVEVRR